MKAIRLGRPRGPEALQVGIGYGALCVTPWAWFGLVAGRRRRREVADSPATAPTLRLLFSESGRVLTIVHRGALDPSRANSMAGICESIGAGFDGVEVDVQATGDGHLVLFHDAALPLNGRSRPVAELSFFELSRAVTEAGGVSVPQLRDGLDTPTLLVLDIKSQGIIDAVVRLVHETNAADREDERQPRTG